MRILGSILLLCLCGSAVADEGLRGRFLQDTDSPAEAQLISYVHRGAKLHLPGSPNMEYSFGMLYSDDGDNIGIVGVGQVWEKVWYTRHGVFSTDLSLATTLMTSAKLEKRDLGGVLQFMSGLGFAWKPSSTSALTLGIRAQHLSNASIHRHNPGMDFVGLEFSWSPQQ